MQETWATSLQAVEKQQVHLLIAHRYGLPVHFFLGLLWYGFLLSYKISSVTMVTKVFMVTYCTERVIYDMAGIVATTVNPNVRVLYSLLLIKYASSLD